MPTPAAIALASYRAAVKMAVWGGRTLYEINLESVPLSDPARQIAISDHYLSLLDEALAQLDAATARADKAKKERNEAREALAKITTAATGGET